MNLSFPYGYLKKVSLSFSEAVKAVTTALKNENFGVLCDIDVQTKFKEKLNKDFTNYHILGACYPLSAYQVLSKIKPIGLLLPCNIIIYEDNSNIYIGSVLPTVTMKEIKIDEIESLACNIENKLKKVIDSVV